MTKSSDYGLPI